MSTMRCALSDVSVPSACGDSPQRELDLLSVATHAHGQEGAPAPALRLAVRLASSASGTTSAAAHLHAALECQRLDVHADLAAFKHWSQALALIPMPEGSASGRCRAFPTRCRPIPSSPPFRARARATPTRASCCARFSHAQIASDGRGPCRWKFGEPSARGLAVVGTCGLEDFLANRFRGGSTFGPTGNSARGRARQVQERLRGARVSLSVQ